MEDATQDWLDVPKVHYSCCDLSVGVKSRVAASRYAARAYSVDTAYCYMLRLAKQTTTTRCVAMDVNHRGSPGDMGLAN